MASFLQHWFERGELKLDVEESNLLVMIGTIGMEFVVLRGENKKQLYLKSISGKSKPMRTIIPENENNSSIVSCNYLRDGKLVCSTDNCEILIYEEDWSRIRAICAMQRDEGTLLVAVDMVDGNCMILAAYEGEPLINAFDPSSGTLLKSVTAGNTSPLKIHQMHALSEGRIVVLSRHESGDWISILEGSSGDIQHRLFSPGRYLSNITVDESRDFIFALHRELPGGHYSVDVIAANGVVIGQRIVEFQSMVLVNTFLVPSPGRLVIQDDKTLRVYELEK